MDSLPAFARVLKQRQMKNQQNVSSSASYSSENRDYSNYDSESHISILDDANSNVPKKKKIDLDIDIESCLRSVSELESADQLFELQKIIKKLEKQNTDLRKENRQIVELQQQIDIEREVSSHYSDALHETQNMLESERQINSSLKERIVQLEQILEGKEQMTEAKTSMTMKLQEEYNHVTKDYQRILDLYNKMVVQLREARTRMSELEAELDNTKNNAFNRDPIYKPKPYEPFNYEDYMKPQNTKNAFDEFDNFGGYEPPQVPAPIKPYSPPIQSYEPPPVQEKTDFTEKANKSPPRQIPPQPKKAALVDNINFGIGGDNDLKDFDLSGYSKIELENMLQEMQADKIETERVLALAPKQGISKSRAMREKEELADKADLLERKIAKIKRELRKM